MPNAQSLYTCNFDQIETPGTYVERRWGTLFRMPAEALPRAKDHSAKTVAREPWFVTRLSRDPALPVTKARRIAIDCDLPVGF